MQCGSGEGKTKAREVREQEESVDVDVVLCKSELVVGMRSTSGDSR